MDAVENRFRLRFSLLALIATAAASAAGFGHSLDWASAAEDAKPANPVEVFQNALTAPDRAAIALLASLPHQYSIDPYLQAAIEIQAKPAAEAADMLRLMAQHDRGNRTVVLCRILFTAKPDGSFRAPARTFGRVLGPQATQTGRSSRLNWSTRCHSSSRGHTPQSRDSPPKLPDHTSTIA